MSVGSPSPSERHEPLRAETHSNHPLSRRGFFDTATRCAAGGTAAAGLLSASSPATAQGAPASPQTAAANKALVRQYFERCWNQGDLDFGREIIAPDYDLHLPHGTPGGYEVWRAGVKAFREVFADIHFDNLQLIAEGDLVAVRSVMSGTHRGAFLGVAPTGRRFAVPNADYYQVRRGKLVAHWDVVDLFSLLRQLGALPEALMAAIPPPLQRSVWPADRPAAEAP